MISDKLVIDLASNIIKQDEKITIFYAQSFHNLELSTPELFMH